MRVSIFVPLSALPRPTLFACGSGLVHVFLGSTAEQVVRRADCHVLIVRENEREFVRNTKRTIGRYRRSRRR